uniref:Inhibitor of DNA binding 3 n=1 Tax=Cyprinus carpio carpio TaxID=630221 RepID=A0A9J8C5B4_CYPCA
MKAISPVRSVRSCYEAVCCISEQSLAISRCKSPIEELSDMNDCYSKLKELVPSIPQNKSVSQVEILQHVIDYIFDLQIALENETDTQSTPDMFMSMKVSAMLFIEPTIIYAVAYINQHTVHLKKFKLCVYFPPVELRDEPQFLQRG